MFLLKDLDVLLTLNMDKFSKLVLIVLLSFVNFLVLQPCHSRLIVDMEVSGMSVVRTGIRAYAVENSYDNVRIRCSSQVSVRATMLLLNNNGQTIGYGVTSEDGALVVAKRIDDPDERYRCMLKISTWVSSNSYSDFVVSSEVEITPTYTVPFCSSSIGNVGYVGESVKLECKVYEYYSNCFYWENTRTKVLKKVVTENFPEQSCACTRYGTYWKACSLSVSILQSIYLNLSVAVSAIHSNTNLEMEFFCTSTPPRLMYWKVFGTYGNLLDFDNIGQYLNINTTVNITQSPGETSLHITETIPGGNGIHTVMCSTYDTEKRVVVFLPITIPSNFENSNFKTTDMQETTSDKLTNTDESSTLTMTTTERVGHFDEFDVQVPTEKGPVMKTCTINNYLLMVFVSLPYLVIIVVLIGITCYMHYRHRNKMQLSGTVPSQNNSPGTVLHENPAYLSFSETKEYIPDNENEEKTYANL